MRTYVVAFCLALIVSALATPVVVWLAHHFDWLDRPTGGRKIHTRAVPRLGGVAVVLAFFTPMLGLAIYENRVSGLLYSDLRLASGLFGGAAIIVGLGVWDDLKGASPKLKLLVQSATAVGMWAVGFRIEVLGNPLGSAFDLGFLSLPLTVLWMVGVVNALNLIDGLDGLASGVALLASTVLFGVAFVDNAALLCLITAALGGSLVGFLFWNFNPAKIFLGDSGSMFLGFLLAAVSIWTQQKGATAAALLIPVLALGLPILDTTVSFVRRVRQGRSPFSADRGHLHHRLLALGLSHRNAVLTLYTASIVFGLGGLALLDTDAVRRAIALSSVVVVAVILVSRLGAFRSVEAEPEPLPSREEIRRVAREVRRAPDPDEAWSRIVAMFPRLEAKAVRLTWVRRGERPSDRRASVYYWREAASRSWPLDRAEVHPNARVFSMSHEDVALGELVVLFDRKMVPHRDADLLLRLELLAEALVEHRIDGAEGPHLAKKTSGAPEIVDFAELRRAQGAAR